MQVKIFSSRHLRELEAALNAWLKEHPISPESMHVQFTSNLLGDSMSYWQEHTLVLFYVPLMPLR